MVRRRTPTRQLPSARTTSEGGIGGALGVWRELFSFAPDDRRLWSFNFRCLFSLKGAHLRLSPIDEPLIEPHPAQPKRHGEREPEQRREPELKAGAGHAGILPGGDRPCNDKWRWVVS
jgi:hypothetical protein